MKKGESVDKVSTVRIVHDALSKLDSETRVQVLQAVSALLQLPPQSAGVGGQQTTQILSPTGQQPQPNLLTATIDKFVAAKRPGDTYQKLACLAYYLEHTERKVDLTIKELRKANTDARQSAISNISQFLDLATRRHGLFTAAGHGKKRLSTRGAAVVEALPDQAAVKTALEQNTMPKKSGRKRSPKPKK